MLLTYSRRLSLRIATSRPWSESFLRASLSLPVSSARKLVSSFLLGCGSSSGGMSPALRLSRTSCQCAAIESLDNSRDNSSNRSFPFCLSGPWQSRQFLLINAETASGFNLTELKETPQTIGGIPKTAIKRRPRRSEKLNDHKKDTQFLKTILHSFTIGNGTRAIPNDSQLFDFIVLFLSDDHR